MLVQSSPQTELAERIARALLRDGKSEPQPGLHLYRRSKPGERFYSLTEPAFCVVAQGSKRIVLGEHLFRYDASHYLITAMELPLVGEVMDASPTRPYLSVKLALDPAVVTSVMMESGLAPSSGGDDMLAIDVSPLDASLLDATLRLVRLIERPSEHRVLGPLVIREIIYRLLVGAQGHRLRRLVTGDGQAHRIARAVEAIRENFDKPLRIAAIARRLGMSVSSFHAHFKAVTAMSPLQFQRQLRLHEARRLLMSAHVDAAEAGYRVGYDDPSHFSREYKRHFGQPPIRDVERLREWVGKPSA
jgi:AraC-like DNA-binding protein